KSYAEFDTKFPHEKRWMNMPKGGETWTDAQTRMVEVVAEINKKYQDKKILIITHGDPLFVLQKYFGSERVYPRKGVVFGMDVSIVDLHRPFIDDVVIKCQECAKSAHRISEIFDSWVEAGSMPFAEYHYPFDQKEVFE